MCDDSAADVILFYDIFSYHPYCYYLENKRRK